MQIPIIGLTILQEFIKMQKRQTVLLYIVTPEMAKANDFFNKRNNYNIPVFSLDATAFKTAARTNPGIVFNERTGYKKQMGLG